MKGVPSKHPPGMILIPSGILSRYAFFQISLDALQIPLGGGAIARVLGPSVAENLNEGIRVLLKDTQDGFKAEWVWLIGDDHTFLPETVMKLLDDEVDVVSPIIYQACAPFMPCVFKLEGSRPGHWAPYTWTDLKALKTLTPIAACGCAGLLVRRHVFEKLSDPWFELGRYRTDALQEDVHFSEKVRQAGFTLYLDPNVSIGHTAACTVTAERKEDGVWVQTLDWGHDAKLHVEMQ